MYFFLGFLAFFYFTQLAFGKQNNAGFAWTFFCAYLIVFALVAYQKVFSRFESIMKKFAQLMEFIMNPKLVGCLIPLIVMFSTLTIVFLQITQRFELAGYILQFFYDLPTKWAIITANVIISCIAFVVCIFGATPLISRFIVGQWIIYVAKKSNELRKNILLRHSAFFLLIYEPLSWINFWGWNDFIDFVTSFVTNPNI